MAKIQQLAQQLYDALEKRERASGDEFYTLKDGSPEWMTEVIHAVHGDKLPDDTVYDMVNRTAGAIADAGDDDIESLKQAVLEIEPDVSSDLTAWLHARADHVYYISEVLEEYGGDLDDGFKLLMLAQAKQIEEIGFALLNELEERESDEYEEEPEEESE